MVRKDGRNIAGPIVAQARREAIEDKILGKKVNELPSNQQEAFILLNRGMRTQQDKEQSKKN